MLVERGVHPLEMALNLLCHKFFRFNDVAIGNTVFRIQSILKKRDGINFSRFLSLRCTTFQEFGSCGPCTSDSIFKRQHKKK